MLQSRALQQQILLYWEPAGTPDTPAQTNIFDPGKNLEVIVTKHDSEATASD